MVGRRPGLGRKQPDMLNIDLSFQQIAFMDQETGECGERRWNYSDGEGEKFNRGRSKEASACVGG